MREGFDLSNPSGKLMLTLLAGVAELERENIKARQMASINKAKADGRKLGAPKQYDNAAIAAWRKETGASIATTAGHWGVSLASREAGLQGTAEPRLTRFVRSLTSSHPTKLPPPPTPCLEPS